MALNAVTRRRRRTAGSGRSSNYNLGSLQCDVIGERLCRIMFRICLHKCKYIALMRNFVTFTVRIVVKSVVSGKG